MRKMKMKKNYLALGYMATLMVCLSGASAFSAELNCAAAPDCESLGYTMAAKDCVDDTIVKCPTDPTKIYCKKKVAEKCQVGSIYYSDKTCSTSVQSGKTPIGVVFDTGTGLITAKGLIIALEEKTIADWGPYGIDIPDLSNCNYNQTLTCSTNGKQNTSKIIAYGKSSGNSYPAAEYANGYSTAGTAAGDWFLPSVAELSTLYTNVNKINNTLLKLNAGVIRLMEDNLYWSSVEMSLYYAGVLRMSDGYAKLLGTKNDNSKTNVRPVTTYSESIDALVPAL